MASSLFPDPLQMWRDALARLENDANALAAGGMKSPELMRSLQHATTVGTGMQQVFEKMVEAYLRRAQLPSRKDLAEVMAALQRIEEKLDRLLPAQDAAPRPARTRRPQAAAAAPEPAPQPARRAARAPAGKTTAARRTSKR